MSYRCAIIFTMTSSTTPANAVTSQHLNASKFELTTRHLLALATVQIPSLSQRFPAITLVLWIGQTALRASNAFFRKIQKIAAFVRSKNMLAWNTSLRLRFTACSDLPARRPVSPVFSSVIDALMRSDEPSIRWKAMVRVAGEPPDSRKVKDLREQIRTSPRAAIASPAACDLQQVESPDHALA